jgi:hypothetical protein
MYNEQDQNLIPHTCITSLSSSPSKFCEMVYNFMHVLLLLSLVVRSQTVFYIITSSAVSVKTAAKYNVMLESFMADAIVARSYIDVLSRAHSLYGTSWLFHSISVGV